MSSGRWLRLTSLASLSAAFPFKTMSICSFSLGGRPAQNGIFIFRSTTEAVLGLNSTNRRLLINGILLPADPGTGSLDKDASIPEKK